MLRVARFLRSYYRPTWSPVREEEVHLDVGGIETPATYLRPAIRGPLPGWILLHGITVPGRNHTLLRRFAHSLAGSGAAVLIPEVPAWQRLRIDLVAGDATISAASANLISRPDVIAPLNLVGFSFGATQALTSASMPEVRDRIGSVLAFGGYCDLGRMIRFMMTGEHEWEGRTRRLDPDPYGRWIAVSNYLLDVPEFAEMHEVVNAATVLAAESGRLGVFAGDPVFDPIKASLREGLPRVQREIWDLVASPSGVAVPRDPAIDLADRLAAAALRRHPEFDPRAAMADLAGRVVLAHGQDDRLIPYTETLRMRRYIPDDVNLSLSITRLFAHSSEADRLRMVEYPAEFARYLAFLNRAIAPSAAPPLRNPRRSR